MPTATLRASSSIAAPTLQRFNALIPAVERSRLVEQLMQQTLLQRESHLQKVADQYLTDPAFAERRADEALWGATVDDGPEGV